MDIEDLRFMIAQGEGFRLEFKESFSDSLNGRFYMRYGANSQQLNRDEIRDFFREENLIGFDDKINKEFNLGNDLDDDKFNRFIEITKISPVIKREKILENLGLLTEAYMKNAGVLLFCRKITKFFLNATIGCFLYMGNTKYKILDKKEFDEDIFSNYHNTIKYLMAHLNTEYIIKDGPREEKLELPEEALREAVLNAIAHRDYFSPANVHVNIFKDRIEITNPGGLMGNLTIEDIYEKSVPRNPLLFGLMERMDLVEKAGSGLVRMEKAMNEYGLGRPDITADKNWFQITFHRPELQMTSYEDRIKNGVQEKGGFRVGENAPVNAPVNAPIKLSDLQKNIIRQMRQNPTVTYDTLSDLFQKDRTTIKRNIRILKESSIITRVGPYKNGHWQVFL